MDTSKSWNEFLTRVSARSGVPLFGGAANEIDPESPTVYRSETETVSPRASGKRMSDFRIGRQAARRALARAGISATAIPRGDSGEPIWPDGVIGSISHSAGSAIAVVAGSSTAAGIGVDLEYRRAVNEIEELVAFDRELDWLASAPSDLRGDRLLELFAVKESLYKAIFPTERKFFGFEDVRLTYSAEHHRFDVEFVASMESFRTQGRADATVSWRGEQLWALVILPCGTSSTDRTNSTADPNSDRSGTDGGNSG